MTHGRGAGRGRGGPSFRIPQDPSVPLCFTLSAGVLFPQVSEWIIHSHPSSPASNMNFPDLHSRPPTQSHTHTRTHRYMYIHWCTQRDTHICHICIPTHINTHACMHTHMHTMYTQKHICTRICAHTHRNTLTHTYSQRERHMHTRAYINTYTHTHIHLHIFSSVQSNRSFVSDSLRPHGLQHTRPSCPSPTTQTHVH